jgi:SHAQKYF class myb-like DNA-binding protein
MSLLNELESPQGENLAVHTAENAEIMPEASVQPAIAAQAQGETPEVGNARTLTDTGTDRDTDTAENNSAAETAAEAAAAEQSKRDKRAILESSSKREGVHNAVHYATLGQMADQVQAQARAELEKAGVVVPTPEPANGADADYGVCENGTESTGRWTSDEHHAFLEAVKKYGKEWKRIAGEVKTRTVVQTRTHAQKYFQKLTKGTSGDGDFTLFSDDEGMGFQSPGTFGSPGDVAVRTSKRSRKPNSTLQDGATVDSDTSHIAYTYNIGRTPSSSTAARRNSGGGNSAVKREKQAQHTVLTTPVFTAPPFEPTSSGTLQDLATAGSVPADWPQPSPAACGTYCMLSLPLLIIALVYPSVHAYLTSYDMI